MHVFIPYSSQKIFKHKSNKTKTHLQECACSIQPFFRGYSWVWAAECATPPRPLKLRTSPGPCDACPSSPTSSLPRGPCRIAATLRSTNSAEFSWASSSCQSSSSDSYQSCRFCRDWSAGVCGVF